MARLVRISNQNNVWSMSSWSSIYFNKLSTLASKQPENGEVIVDKLKDKQSGIAVSLIEFDLLFSWTNLIIPR